MTAESKPLPARREIIRLNAVSKHYPGEDGAITAIQDLDFSVFPAEFVTLIGPSGCGKTSLLNLIAGLESPSSGAVLFHEKPLEGVPRDIGYVFQEPTLLPWRTIFHNVSLPLEIGNGAVRRDAVDNALDAVGLLAFRNEYPGSLSVGMRQKVAIARALVHDPEVLLMDEPFSSLDSISRTQLNFQLLELWHRMKKTIVFVTHSISEAVLLSDRVCLLTGRPASVSQELTVGLPRPRDPGTLQLPQFATLLATIHQAFGSLTRA